MPDRCRYLHIPIKDEDGDELVFLAFKAEKQYERLLGESHHVKICRVCLHAYQEEKTKAKHHTV